MREVAMNRDPAAQHLSFEKVPLKKFAPFWQF
jgi:hypothetical protein